VRRLNAISCRQHENMEPRIVDGLKVIEVEPGAPLPPGVPAWAERCDLTDTTRFSPAARPWAIAAGVLGAVGSIALWTLTGVGAVFLAISLWLLYRALFANTEPTLTPSASGRYLAFDEGIPHEESGIGVATRFASLVVGALMIVGAGVALYSGEYSRIGAIAIGAGGCYLFYRGVKGPDPRDEPVGERTPLRFHALADPTRQLAPEDLRLHADGALPRKASSSGEPHHEIDPS
jgi:hypothetical protein